MKKFLCSLLIGFFAVCMAAEPEMMPGKVRVKIDNGKVTEFTVRGYADMAERKPMTPNTILWMASNGKPVTAVAFMRLVDAGKVKLDDPVARYLPYMKYLYKKENGKIVPVKTPVTLRHLLSHTSGLGFVPGNGVLSYGADLCCVPLESQARIYAASLLNQEPGVKFGYSNAGIDIIGRVIEVVSGMDYESYMKKYLFDPMEMPDTGYRLNTEQMTRLIQGYDYDFKVKAWKAVPNPQLCVLAPDSPARFPECGGGLFSTPEDYSHFVLMIANGGVYKGKRIVSAESLKEMCRRQSPQGGRAYGLGSNGEGAISHGGGGSGSWSVPGSGKGSATFCQVYSKWPDKTMPTGHLVGAHQPDEKSGSTK